MYVYLPFPNACNLLGVWVLRWGTEVVTVTVCVGKQISAR